ncbi:KR domain protein [Leptospira yanagawae serovar Saopaulo str. Sao Paulo = ATCC 700523]|uniref:KR domain protein n=1 Tax=Leptospira yanagawae serovar Saopaulo str. Sao Paulo = ATCC 700523 TaxID=1249483 RepID=A0A5E8HA58_9LEPT|nr:SDR family NAD(P)-dependent oxidoreductase [Leptospira yanagawae]EOQ87742.1 KR domain protein [Leptospira yanagawae serovar Saopaulo str. Sao Paulo = ATCC 700523]
MNGIKRYKLNALITGASSGIGKDFAYELAKNEYSLTLVARDLGRLNEIKHDLESKYKIKVKVDSKDLSKNTETNELVNGLKSEDYGLVVLAAGYGSGGKFHSLDLDTELNMIDVNCRSVVQICHEFIQNRKDESPQGIVLFGSLVGFQGVPWTSTYAATKAFIQSFAEGLSGEYKNKGIDIISVAPGPVKTSFGNRAGMVMGNAQSPDGIAKEVLKKLGKTVTVRPGFLSKFLGYSLITLPRNLRTFVLKQIMGQMVFGSKG